MSMERKEKITCPNCEAKNDFIVWQSLNGDIDPEAKQQLLNGTLFNFKCKKCGYESKVNYPILYHDMKHNVMIHCVPEEEVEEAYKGFIESENAIDIKLPNYTKRIVTNHNSLREKAIIFENELDDRIIEIIKLFHLAKVSEQIPDANITDVFFYMSDDKYFFDFLGGQRFTSEIPLTMYKDIKNMFAERLKDESDLFFVGTGWAHEFLMKK